MTDKTLVGKVLDIAISNALKYSESGSQVNISYAPEGGKNSIYIKDQGPGLSGEELKLIFKKYQKLTPKPTLGEATTGLGMYLAREFMKMMKGEITAENNPQGGLVVRIIL
jgi:K+-sensing histidine kinase KdpD